MDDENLIVSRDDGLFVITLNRPAALNAITPDMHYELEAAFDFFAGDDTAQVCVITGAGDRAFCAGSDLRTFRAKDGAPHPTTGYAGVARRFDLNKPVIAAVNGLCLGGGLELALACDIVLAADDAMFALPEPRVGLIAIGGGIGRLVRDAGLKRAMIPLLTGAPISAEEGLSMGFVSEIAPASRLMDRARELAGEIMACAPLAVRATKDLAYHSLDAETLADALDDQEDIASFREWQNSDDAIEGVAAFNAKRPPVFKGS